MGTYTFNDFYSAKIDTKEDILAFVTLCKDFAASVSDVNSSKTCFSFISIKFFTIVQKLAEEMECLHKEFERNGSNEKIVELRRNADSIYDVAEKVIEIIDLLPYELTSKDEWLQNNDNAASAWARFAFIAEKLVSDEIAQNDILAKDKFLNLVSATNKQKIEDVIMRQSQLLDDCIKAKYDSLVTYGNIKMANFLDEVYSHKFAIDPTNPQVSTTTGNSVQPTSTKKNMDDRQTTVMLRDRSKLLLFIPAFAAPFMGFFLYGQWWMFFCVLLVGLIQIFPWAFLYDTKEVAKTIYVSQMDDYVLSEKRLDIIMRVLFVILAILNLFPFLASSSSFMYAIRGFGVDAYEGGILVTIITLVLIGAWLLIAILNTPPSILSDHALLIKQGITHEEKSSAENKARRNAYEIQMKQQKERYGVGYVSLGYNLYVNEEMKKFFVGTKEYKFKDLLNFDVRDNAITIHSASTSTAKTNAKSMIGRTVVGGVLFGNVGAVIGGATASKTIEHSASKSSIVHDYSIVITVNNISSPIETIKIGKDETALDKIVSTLTVILSRN